MQSNGHNDGLLSTVADSDAINAGAAAQTQTQPQPIGRLGNLERLIKDLNTNLPDPAALMRQPNQLAANKQFFQPMPEPRQLISALTDANHGFPVSFCSSATCTTAGCCQSLLSFTLISLIIFNSFLFFPNCYILLFIIIC